MTTPVAARKFTPAKRGDLFVFPAHSFYTLVHGPSESSVSYPLAVVTSVSREGVIKGYRTVGDSFDQRCTPMESSLVAATRVDVEAAKAAYIARGEAFNRSFSTLEDVKAFFQPFKKSSETT